MVELDIFPVVEPDLSLAYLGLEFVEPLLDDRDARWCEFVEDEELVLLELLLVDSAGVGKKYERRITLTSSMIKSEDSNL